MKLPQRKTVLPRSIEHFDEYDLDFFNDSNALLLVMVADKRHRGNTFVKVWPAAGSVLLE